MGEYEALLMEEEMNIPVSILSLHNVYGSPCDFGVEKSQVIPSLIRKAVCYPEEPFVVWGSGSQGRAFVHVDDVVDALVATMTKGLGHGVIQIGPDVCTSIKKLPRWQLRFPARILKFSMIQASPKVIGAGVQITVKRAENWIGNRRFR